VSNHWHFSVSFLLTIALFVFYLGIAAFRLAECRSEIRAAWNGTDHLHASAVVLHALLGAIFYFMLAIFTLTRKPIILRDGQLVGWILPAATMFSFGIAGSGSIQPVSIAIILLAIMLIIAGMMFSLYSLRYLGRHFGIVADVRGLVTTGPYRLVRHPLYLGEATVLAGIVMVTATSQIVFAFAIAMMLQALRARREERRITQVFPEYREYSSRTPMIVPSLLMRFRRSKPIQATE
jgi:protein-S-isoprenylcysteine O-methyltransferase Ste14